MNYEEQAAKFLESFGLSLEIKAAPFNEAPPWDQTGKPHGQQYVVRLSRRGGKSLVFPFWGSLADARECKAPSEYSVLACLSSDSTSPDTADEVVQEYCSMKPSQAEMVAAFGRKVRKFFTPAELSALQEIQ